MTILLDTDRPELEEEGADHDAVSPEGPAVEFESRIGHAQLATVLAGGTLTNPMVLAVMLAGPVFLLMGWLTGSAAVRAYGVTFLVTLPAVPIVAYGVALFLAYRPRTAEVFKPVKVRVDLGGVTLAVEGRETRAGWDSFVRWRRMPGAHLLYESERTFLVLQTAGLDETQRGALEKLLRTRVAEGPKR